MSFCSKFSQLCFCHIQAGKSIAKITRVNFLLTYSVFNWFDERPTIVLLQTRNAFWRGTWYLPHARPQCTNCSNNYGRMHCACAKRPYFDFRSKIWRYHRVPRPRFPLRRDNFGDSHTFKADIGLIFAWVFRTSWPKCGFGGQNRGRGRAILTLNELVLPFGGIYICANFGENWSRNATVRVLADGQTDWHTDRRKPIL